MKPRRLSKSRKSSSSLSIHTYGGSNNNLTTVKKKQPKWKKKVKIALHKFSKILTIIIAGIQLLDFSFASLETQDFLGSGEAFKNTAREANEFVNFGTGLSRSSIIPSEKYGPEVLSKYGYLMLEQMGASPDDYNWGSVGYFDITKSTEMEMCRNFKDTFRNIPHNNSRLMLFRETMSYIKPLSVSTPDDVSFPDGSVLDEYNLSVEQLHYLESPQGGYVGAQRAIDIRLTDRINFGNPTAGTTGSAYVTVFKHQSKSFCDGCFPMAELGGFHCELDYTVLRSSDGTIDIEVTKALNEPGSLHNLGLAYPSSAASQAEFFFKVFLIIWLTHIVLYSISGAIKSHEAQVYLASKSSDGEKTMNNNALTSTRRNFFLEWLMPQHFQTGDPCFSIGFIIYNSDFIVFSQALFTLGSLIQSLTIQREVIWWYLHDSTLRSFVTRTAINGRIMWIYLAIFKALKAIYVRLRGPEQAKKMIFHNNFFVVLFIGSLFLLDRKLDIFFSNRIDLVNNPTLASNAAVHVFDGFYVQRLPMVFVHSILSVLLVYATLQLLEAFLGKPVEDVSVYEIFAGSHLTVLWDPDVAHVLPHRTGRSLLFMPIGTLMNLKWFMNTHFITMSTSLRKRTYAMETAEDSYGNSLSRTVDSAVVLDERAEEERTKRRAAEETNLFCRLSKEGSLDIKSVNDSTSLIPVEQTAWFYKWIKANSRVKIH